MIHKFSYLCFEEHFKKDSAVFAAYAAYSYSSYRGGGSGGGEARGARGAMAPPIKFSMMLFFCKL